MNIVAVILLVMLLLLVAELILWLCAGLILHRAPGWIPVFVWPFVWLGFIRRKE